jgi:polysaccharide export outer membrane protein
MVEGYTTTFELPTLKVQPDDILYIMVNSLSDETSAPYNMAAGGNRGGGGGGGNGNNQLLLQGYAVDSMGYIDFPSIGRIRVGGMALEGVRRTIAEALEPYLKNAAINVKFLNFRYTIIGDVAAPGTYTTINERVSLLEALGTAGDLTPYAERNRILLIREKDDERRVARINLQDPSFFDSPYYYLQQNDVIYIEPTEAKVATVADPTSRFISFGSAFLSLVTFTLALISSTRN